MGDIKWGSFCDCAVYRGKTRSSPVLQTGVGLQGTPYEPFPCCSKPGTPFRAWKRGGVGRVCFMASLLLLSSQVSSAPVRLLRHRGGEAAALFSVCWESPVAAGAPCSAVQRSQPCWPGAGPCWPGVAVLGAAPGSPADGSACAGLGRAAGLRAQRGLLFRAPPAP